MLQSYFDYVFVAPKTQGSIKSKLTRNFVNLKPEPDPKIRPDLLLLYVIELA